MSVRNLAFFANKDRKFAKEFGGGKWVKTIHKDIEITAFQKNGVIDFINNAIQREKLDLSDIIMLIGVSEKS